MLRAPLHENEIRRVIGVAGEGDREVDGVAILDSITDRCLCFVNATPTPAIRTALATRRGCIVIARPGWFAKSELPESLVLETSDPRASITRVLQFIRAEEKLQPWVAERRISPEAVISPQAIVEGDVEIESGTVIEPFSYVGPQVRIGRGAVIRSGARIHPRVTIGERSEINGNSIIGHEGYGFVRDDDGNKMRMPHLGGVLIGSDVEIGSLTTVQGGTITPTVIEDFAKIDDHVHVGHNVRVGRNASVTCGVVLTGHTIVEEEAWIGVNSSIREGCRVGAHALVGMDVSLQHDLADRHVARAPRPDVRERTDNNEGAIGFAKR